MNYNLFSYICIVIVAAITNQDIRGNTINRLDLAATISGQFNFMKKIDLTGKRFGRLLVIDTVKEKTYKIKWICLCDCGNTSTPTTNSLKNGTKSCGCLAKEIVSNKFTTHGLRNHELYGVWKAMFNRTCKPNYKGYHRYGGRGIKMCDSWKNSFVNFLNDVGERPSKKHSLDRIDNNGNYEPSNIRWATQKEQMNNTRVCVNLLDLETGIYYTSIIDAAKAIYNENRYYVKKNIDKRFKICKK